MFRKVTFLIILCSFAFGFDYNLKPKKVSEDIWCFFGKTEVPSKENGGFMSNSCYIKADNSYILIDSGVGYDFAKQAYDAMQKIEKLPVNNIIVTHSHDDHWLGNSFYKEKFNAKIYGPKTINSEFNENSEIRGVKVLSSSDQKKSKFIPIDEIINENTDLKIGNKDLKIIPMKDKVHTSDDLIIYLPNEKVMFVGDIIMNERITSNRDGSVIGTLKALELINSYPWQTLIAGHGTNTSKSALEHTKNYFTLLKSRVLEAIDEGIMADEITKIVTMEDFKDIAMFDELNSRNVFDTFRELEFYDEE